MENIKNNIIEFLYQKRKLVIIVAIVLILSIILIVVFNKSSKKPQEVPVTPSVVSEKIVLFGDLTVNLNLGEEYNEPGFYAVNSNNIILTKNVLVTNNINKDKAGTYQVTYKLGNILKTRQVVVKDNKQDDEENPETPADSVLTLTLTGDNVITLSKNQTYVEPGYQAYDTILGDMTNKVTVVGSVNSKTPGTYTLTYRVSNGKVQKEIIRTIVVIDDELIITITPNKTTYTNSAITLNIKVTGSSFSSLVLPNNVVVKQKETTYTISNNGTYTVTAYNGNLKKYTKSIQINTIDTSAPTGTCQATINQASTNIKVTAKDNLSGIASYVYYDNGSQITSSTSDSYNYSKKTTKVVAVRIYDKAGNSNLINCSVIDNSALPVIKPGSSENIVKQSETETLKVYITKKSKYYITRIWAYDPYTQLNKFDSPEYGKNLYRPKALLEKARSSYNLTNKLIVGFNASGFYLKDTYDASSVSKYAGYDKTSVGTLVITNGKVIRNVYDKAYKTWFVTGVDRNNVLRIFKDEKSTDTNAKMSWANSVISSGIRNTFTFASPLIENGIESTEKTSMPQPSTKENRQAICQVNANNFALITGDGLDRATLISVMKSLNCQTGTNLDGGGSIALLYQAKNSSTIETIIGNNRSLTEVGYFTE